MRAAHRQRTFRARISAAVAERYPESEPAVPEDERQGSIPPAVLAEIEKDRLARETRIRSSGSTITLEKNATPGDATRDLEDCLADTRAKAFHCERSTDACSDPAAIQAGGLEQFRGDLHIQTESGNKFVDHWKSESFARIMPFVITRMVSGPDYDEDRRWRRTFVDAPFVHPDEFMRGFARRIELQVRQDTTAVPIVRSTWFRWTAEHTASVLWHYKGHRGKPLSEVANELIDAMTGLHHKLWYGFVGQGKRKVPIAGDTTRLPFANNLSALQKKLAWNMQFLAQNLPGVQQVRQLMGHCQFGARVNYGDTLFMTVSPNPQHSGFGATSLPCPCERSLPQPSSCGGPCLERECRYG